MKTESVLDLLYVSKHEYWTHFGMVLPEDEESGTKSHILTMTGDTWHEMGDPKKVTVTVEPGDRLNEV